MTNGSPDTTMEKLAGNVFAIVLARGAMIVTPVLFWIVWTSLENRITAIERVVVVNSEKAIDHETRLTVGKAAREEFQKQTVRQFDGIEASLKEVQVQLGILNGTIIRLETLLNARAVAEQPVR